MTYETMVLDMKKKGFNTFDTQIIARGHPFLAGLSLEYIGDKKLKNRKMLRVEEVRDILAGISVDLIFKKVESGDKIKIDQVTFQLIGE